MLLCIRSAPMSTFLYVRVTMHHEAYKPHSMYTLNKNTLKQLIIAEIWVVYGYYISFYPCKTHISYTFCRQPISSPYHGYNYSYLMLTNFIGSSYMSDYLYRAVYG